MGRGIVALLGEPSQDQMDRWVEIDLTVCLGNTGSVANVQLQSPLSIVNERAAADETERQVHGMVDPARVVAESFEVVFSLRKVSLDHGCNGLVEALLFPRVEGAGARRELVRRRFQRWGGSAEPVANALG